MVLILYFSLSIPACSEPFCSNMQKCQTIPISLTLESHFTVSYVFMPQCLSVVFFLFVCFNFARDSSLSHPSTDPSYSQIFLGHTSPSFLSSCTAMVSRDGSVCNKDILKHGKQAWPPQKIVWMFIWQSDAKGYGGNDQVKMQDSRNFEHGTMK